MACKWISFLAVTGLSIVGAVPLGDGPVFPPQYTAAGYILLPYCELKEPFVAYYDGNVGKSRIDFYNGEMKTFMSKQGSYKVVWSPNEKTHVPEENCYLAGAEDAQTVLPDLSQFKFIRTEPCETGSTTLVKPFLRSSKCYRYENKVQRFGRTSKYTFWAAQDEKGATPIRYEMLGYDSLLGSHFDKYEIVYSDYRAGPVDRDMFKVNEVIKKDCIDFPSPPGLSSAHLFNPMRQFINGHDAHVDEHFSHFKSTHGKEYAHQTEETIRKDNFRHNQRFVDSMNRRNLSYALKLNNRADWSREELKLIRGRLQQTNAKSYGKVFPMKLFAQRPLPDYVDWRLEGAVSPVKDQAICGSCWSFATVGHIEGIYFLKYGELIRFSEQQLIDCSWSSGNDACDGGLDFISYDYIKKYGLSSDEQYGPYRGIDGKCKDIEFKTKPIATLKGYTNVTNENELRKALAFVGPISVSIDASRPSFSFYSHGVYKDPDCSSTELDHAVLAVGYGTLHGEPYWLIKNSWSTHWGNDGYVLISQEDNMCGVTSQATYVEL
ncbi:digestive cysteine proteinase 2-like [Varroa jacobsoni]|uniref:digestive cysteine proteinase 2-like n=1 Tax=Varroa jacobsoni TaxID=62625 RepID=UPI000BF44E65|nr:digestive cysteine proteinase 2-like [Varroa jacobsoni]